jgi:hypothetical protein
MASLRRSRRGQGVNNTLSASWHGFSLNLAMLRDQGRVVRRRPRPPVTVVANAPAAVAHAGAAAAAVPTFVGVVDAVTS